MAKKKAGSAKKAGSNKFVTEVVSLLAEVGDVRAKAMFGGYGIYCGPTFFALIAHDRLYFKVDDSNKADFEAAGSTPFVPFEGSAPMAYWELPASVLSDVDELKVWVDKALNVAETAKRPRKKK